MDAEDFHTGKEFATELIAGLLSNSKLRTVLTSAKRLPARIMGFLRGLAEEASFEGFGIKLREALDEDWQSVAKRLLVEMEKATERVLFVVDEFPQLVENIAKKEGADAARSFLGWFRTVRMQQKDELRKFRFVIGGSTSVDMVLRRLDVLGALNDFFRVPVEPLALEDAQVLLDGLADAHDLRLGSEAKDKIFELIGPPVAYFIHLFVAQIMHEQSLAGKKLTAEDVEAVYRRRVLGPTCRSYFVYYRDRLKRYGTAGERAAIAVLSAIAEAPNGRVADSSLYEVYRKARKKGAKEVEYREIMADLESDWYVVLDTATNEYYFLIDVMRDWWNRFYHKVAKKTTRRKRK